MYFKPKQSREGVYTLQLRFSLWKRLLDTESTRTSFIQLKLSFSYISLMEYLSLLTHFGRETKGRQMDKYFYPADGNQSPGTALSTGSGKEVTAEAKPRLTRFQLGTSVTISPSSWC